MEILEMEIIDEQGTPMESDVIFSGEFIHTISRDTIYEAVEEFFTQNDVMVSPSKKSTVTLLASNWVGEDLKYEQQVTIEGTTPNSQVDLTPSDTQLEIFYDKKVMLTTKNIDGTVYVVLIGQKLENDYTMQVTITEVDYE